MKTSDFYFDLPKELIAQKPIEPRDHSRLLVLSRENTEILDKHFYDIVDYLEEGDTLVLNDSRVIPARIFGHKRNCSGKVEFLLLEQQKTNEWEVLIKPGRKAKIGEIFDFGDGILSAEIIDILEDGNRICRFTHNMGSIYDVLEIIGNMPLPPYITEKLEDKERYQTVYSKDLGSAAAPTAGLHFTEDLLRKLNEKGVNLAYITLHVGLGTFRPVKVTDITQHKMHSEHYYCSTETAEMINKTKIAGKKVYAVGTTSCRTLESIATFKGEISESEGYTDIFIYPGYKFKVLDGLITNFHLPESTLIMLVSAFAGYDNTMNAYRHAVDNRYRFFSFGDAMLIK